MTVEPVTVFFTIAAALPPGPVPSGPWRAGPVTPWPPTTAETATVVPVSAAR